MLVRVPSRWITNFMPPMPAAPWFLFQFSVIRWFIVAMYSGQQKSPTLICTPPLPPPPVESPPNGIGAAPVSAFASPVLTSGPVVGLRLADFSAGLSTLVAGRGFTVAFGSGTVISGALAAGGGSTRGFGSGGATAWTDRPDSCVMPPALGPTAPPSEMNIGFDFSLAGAVRQLAGINTNPVKSTAWAASDTTSIRESPSV